MGQVTSTIKFFCDRLWRKFSGLIRHSPQKLKNRVSREVPSAVGVANRHGIEQCEIPRTHGVLHTGTA